MNQTMAKDRPQRRRHSKPKIRRQESWRYKRLSESWRKPRGKSSRMRIRRKGWPTSPRIGYKSPAKERGLHPSGLREVLVHRPEELTGLSPEKEVVRIAAGVGERKRVTIADQAQQLGLRILNLKAPKAAEPETSAPEEPLPESSQVNTPNNTGETPEEPEKVNQE